MPAGGEMRSKWIQAIQKHQKYDQPSPRYFVCALHFDFEHFQNVKSNSDFKSKAIPLIFPSKGVQPNLENANTDDMTDVSEFSLDSNLNVAESNNRNFKE